MDGRNHQLHIVRRGALPVGQVLHRHLRAGKNLGQVVLGSLPRNSVLGNDNGIPLVVRVVGRFRRSGIAYVHISLQIPGRLPAFNLRISMVHPRDHCPILQRAVQRNSALGIGGEERCRSLRPLRRRFSDFRVLWRRFFRRAAGFPAALRRFRIYHILRRFPLPRQFRRGFRGDVFLLPVFRRSELRSRLRRTAVLRSVSGFFRFRRRLRRSAAFRAALRRFRLQRGLRGIAALRLPEFRRRSGIVVLGRRPMEAVFQTAGGRGKLLFFDGQRRHRKQCRKKYQRRSKCEHLQPPFFHLDLPP